ncbi:MAG TPA: ABC transporter permease subunit [Gemmatimonadaceae bacterium]|nr:ABC transporter permease subunit [Gemmatimonadaceae bacterium]
MTRALVHKTWLETRTRFVVGVIVTLAVCGFFTLAHSWIESNWQRDLIEHPEYDNPAWFLRVMRDYPFYLYHFVYADFFQKIWVFLAVLLGIGGLQREAAHGTAAFTLSLPVSRAKLFITRALVAVTELFALAAIALLAIAIGSAIMRLPYPIDHGISHLATLFTGGLIFLAAALCLGEFVEGENTPVVIALGAIGLLYFVMQPYVDGAPLDWFAVPFAVPKLMAGPADITRAADIPWLGFIASLGAAGLLAVLGIRRTQRSDY